jgi:cytidine deaminase
MHDAGSGRALLAAAREAVEAAYAPYSDYAVGAALRTADGTVFTGCNVENANFTDSLHAEAVALGSAVAAGHRSFEALAVSSAARDGVLPCGSCRQTLAEFCGADFPVLVEPVDGDEHGAIDPEAKGAADATGEAPDPTTRRLGDLLPDAIGPAALGVDAHGQ